MRSKNKPAQTRQEAAHAALIADMACVICDAPPPSQVHEIEQGMWMLSLPLCEDCHTGSFNGLHGQRRMWAVKKMTEHSALNETYRRIFTRLMTR